MIDLSVTPAKLALDCDRGAGIQILRLKNLLFDYLVFLAGSLANPWKRIKTYAIIRHMVITWFGLSSFKISSGDLTLVTDPFSKTVGLLAPRVQTNIVTISNIKNEAYNNAESLGGTDTFVIDGPGEFDVKGLFVRGLSAEGDEKNKDNGFDYTTIYAVRMEELRLGIMGSLKQKQLTESQLEDLGEVDILFIPVGGHAVCDAENAVTIVNQIEPRIVVPCHFAQKGLKLNLDKLDQFLKEIGSTKSEPQDKLTLKKSGLASLPGTLQVAVLTPQR